MISFAVDHKKKKILRWLLKQPGVDIDQRNKHGMTYLFGARTQPIAKILLERGADVAIKNKRGWTAFATLVLLERIGRDVMQIMLEYGADLNEVIGKKSLLEELFECNPEQVPFLLERGARMTDNIMARAQEIQLPIDVLSCLKQYRKCDVCFMWHHALHFKQSKFCCDYCQESLKEKSYEQSSKEIIPVNTDSGGFASQAKRMWPRDEMMWEGEIELTIYSKDFDAGLFQ